MAITRNNFHNGKFKKRTTTDRTMHPVVKFLRKNHRNAFTVKEIADGTKMKQETIRSLLAKARKDGLVEHTAPYFIAVVKTHNRSKSKKRK